MKLAKRILLIAILLALPALPLAAWFRATTDSELWPPISAEEVKFRPLVEVGRPLAKPAYLFVNSVMTKVDYRYSCAGAWHPIFRISFVILSMGYSGCLALGALLIRQAILRHKYQAEQGGHGDAEEAV